MESSEMEYAEEDFIQVAKEGFGFGFSDYKYRVMDKQKIGATHHTNDLDDAKRWFHKCREYWIEMDFLSCDQ
jgi:hypothetical protein